MGEGRPPSDSLGLPRNSAPPSPRPFGLPRGSLSAIGNGKIRFGSWVQGLTRAWTDLLLLPEEFWNLRCIRLIIPPLVGRFPVRMIAAKGFHTQGPKGARHSAGGRPPHRPQMESECGRLTWRSAGTYSSSGGAWSITRGVRRACSRPQVQSVAEMPRRSGLSRQRRRGCPRGSGRMRATGGTRNLSS